MMSRDIASRIRIDNHKHLSTFADGRNFDLIGFRYITLFGVLSPSAAIDSRETLDSGVCHVAPEFLALFANGCRDSQRQQRQQRSTTHNSLAPGLL
jgi:hypothetical protein